jgi:hypothetical protein
LWRLITLLADKKEEKLALTKDSILTELPLVMGFTDGICSLSLSLCLMPDMGFKDSLCICLSLEFFLINPWHEINIQIIYVSLSLIFFF